MQKIALYIVVILGLLSFVTVIPSEAEQEAGSGTVSSAADSYTLYIRSHQNLPDGAQEFALDPLMYSSDSVGVQSTGQALMTAEDSVAVWPFEVESAGFYNIRIDYLPAASRGGAMERDLLLDGESPFSEARGLQFSRAYRDDAIVCDEGGNDVRPQTHEIIGRMTAVLRDSSECIAEDLRFYLTVGRHTLTLSAVRESMTVVGIEFLPAEKGNPYSGYLAASQKRTPNNTGAAVQRIEAETPSSKSSFTIYPLCDRSSAGSNPQDPVKSRINAIGGANWLTAGQWLEWTFDISEPGLYKIAPRFLQSAYSGSYVSRRILIDGRLLFDELAAVKFRYGSGYQVTPLGSDREEFRFYFDKGKHTLRMTAVLGDMAEALQMAESVLKQLNQDYLRILMITGSTPDIYRDYSFRAVIPDVIADLQVQYDILNSLMAALSKESGAKGEFTSPVLKVTTTLKRMLSDPESIAQHLLNFKDNLSSFGAWTLSVRQQPLLLDSLYVFPADDSTPKADVSFRRKLVFSLKAFFLSFFEDYQTVSSGITAQDYAEDRVVRVWVSTGRDQSEIISQLAKRDFSVKYGLKADLELVAAGSVLPSVLAGTGPDVAMSMGSGDPVNYALRHAVVDLRRFDDLDEVLTRFHPGALAPYTFDGHVYALPETMSFPMMFCRNDILEGLGLKPPKTWDEFYAMIPVLQRQHMQIGFPVNTQPGVISNANLQAYKIFLYQYGGSLYKDNFTASALDSDLNLDCFSKLTDLFRLYGFPVTYDFANRFRSGEMPVGIVDYTLYNQLTVFAPEIRGLWSMQPLPGIRRQDGSINNTSPCDSAAVMMLSRAANPENAWAFMKWWTDEETQTAFSLEMESLIGPSAKQPTSNIAVLRNIPWTAAEYKALSAQMEQLSGTPEVPGGYYTARAVDFAFAGVYSQNQSPVTAVLDNITDLNDEINRKRAEFGLT